MHVLNPVISSIRQSCANIERKKV